MMSKTGNKYACDYTLVAINLVGDALNCNGSSNHSNITDRYELITRSNSKDKEFDSHNNNNNNNNNRANGDSNNNNNNNNNCNEDHHNSIIQLSLANSGDILGFVTMSSLSISLNEFRVKMREQLPSLPSQFGFLSKEGWPVSDVQEMNLSLYYVISDSLIVMIRRLFDKQRFGIQAMNGVSLGFIFAELEDTAHEIRAAINREFRECALREENGYLLVDRNDWPITMRQEGTIKVWDLMKNGVIRIIPTKRSHHDTTDYAMEVVEENLDTTMPTPPQKKKKRPSEASTLNLDLRNVSADETFQPIISMGHSEHSNSAAIVSASAETQYRPLLYENKPILISYVRAEAEQHARQLKSELNELGCPVFLDVDEIEGGHDWQDALNNAVLNCDLFVPLITPQYGYTQWTNREVKLADIKHKSILPISFLTNWPPECLAIQFASTQFIPWKKTQDIEKAIEKGEGERAQDIRFWDQPYVKTTAERIAEHYHNQQQVSIASVSATTAALITPEFQATATIQTINQTSLAPLRPQSLSHPFLLSTPAAMYVQQQQHQAIANESVSSPKKRINIVISAHPQQREFVALLRDELTKLNFDVWSSTDMTFGNSSGDMCSDILSPMTPPMMTGQSSQVECGSTSDHSSDQTLYLGGAQTRRNSESSQDSQIPSSNDMIDRMRKRLTFTLNSDTTPINYAHSSQNFGSSQCEFYSQQSNFSPEDLDKAKAFRQRADASCIVIMVLSKSYCASRTCKQQAFYCNFRKALIPVKYDEFQMPHWVTKLFDDEDLISGDSDQSRITTLKKKVLSLASSKDILTFKCAMSEAKVHSLASYISKKLPVNDKKKIFVYISGSTKFFSPLSEPICRAIGQALASIPYLTLVTGGCYGCGDTVGRSFCEERELVLKEKPAHLYHILPRHVSKDATLKARQNSDGTFQTVPFGHTLFIGQSFAERDSVVARLFNYCILIEGGPRSARIAEEFVWHDNIVIPIICTGGAAAGHFELPPKIHDVPIGVHKDDWSTLVRRDVTAENIAEAVKNIIYCLAKCRLRKKAKESKHQTGVKSSSSSKTRVTKVRTK